MTTANTDTTNTGNTDSFNEKDVKDLKNLERKIKSNLKKYYSLGETLNIVKVRKLQTVKGYNPDDKGFEQYLRDRFDISKVYCYKMIQAYQVCITLQDYGYSDMPMSESQCRPLALLLSEPEKLVQVWEQVTSSKERITAKKIKTLVDEIRGKGSTNKESDNSGSESNNDSSNDSNNESEKESKGSAKDELIAQLKAELAKKEREAEELRAELAQRRNMRGSIPSSKLARELFKAGFRAVSKKYHPDHGGTSEQMREVLELKKKLGI